MGLPSKFQHQSGSIPASDALPLSRFFNFNSHCTNFSASHLIGGQKNNANCPMSAGCRGLRGLCHAKTPTSKTLKRRRNSDRFGANTQSNAVSGMMMVKSTPCVLFCGVAERLFVPQLLQQRRKRFFLCDHNSQGAFITVHFFSQ